MTMIKEEAVNGAENTFVSTAKAMIREEAFTEEEKAFVFDVQTTGASETFSLPFEATGTYDFNVDWGDESSDDITVWNQAEVTHTYASAGTYEIKITGTITGWRFNWGGDRTKIYELKSWGSLKLGNNGYYFGGCTNLTITATDILDLTGTTNLEGMLDSCGSLTTVPSMNSWDVSSVINMAYLFWEASLFNQDISSWDVSSVENMEEVLYGCSVFNQDISSWNTASLTSTCGMLHGASAFNQDISSWDMSLVTCPASMFRETSAFNQDLSSWDMSSATTMFKMFYNALGFDQNIGSWNITSVTTMEDMFFGVTLSTANYDALWIGWKDQEVQNNILFHGGNSKYSAGAAAAARQSFIDDYAWTIIDAGQA